MALTPNLSQPGNVSARKLMPHMRVLITLNSQIMSNTPEAMTTSHDESHAPAYVPRSYWHLGDEDEPADEDNLEDEEELPNGVSAFTTPLFTLLIGHQYDQADCSEQTQRLTEQMETAEVRICNDH
jgi:hypothetical protein